MKHSIPKVFVDTNVWFSAFYGSRNCEQILKGYIEGKFIAVVSEKVIEELVRNVAEKRPNQLRNLKLFLESFPPVIVRTPTRIAHVVKQKVDIKDQKIFQAAVNAHAEYFITGNIKHFAVKDLNKKYKISVLSPAQAIETLALNSLK